MHHQIRRSLLGVGGKLRKQSLKKASLSLSGHSERRATQGFVVALSCSVIRDPGSFSKIASPSRPKARTRPASNTVVSQAADGKAKHKQPPTWLLHDAPIPRSAGGDGVRGHIWLHRKLGNTVTCPSPPCHAPMTNEGGDYREGQLLILTTHLLVKNKSLKITNLFA